MSTRSEAQLRQDALAIWHAGVEAVRSDRLVREALHLDDAALVVGEHRLPLAPHSRIVVVGAGKAGAGMVQGVEEALGPEALRAYRVGGWVNVPQDCVRPTRCIHLHGARPAGVNEPMPAGVAGAEEILRLVGALGPDDICLCLISGGGSALLPLPAPGVTLEDKLALTRFLSAAGATIEVLNTVRKQLSRVKGGRLAQACRAGQLASLVISDVLGDPLDVIASGPTVPDTATIDDAREVLRRYQAQRHQVAPGAVAFLERPQPATSAARVTARVHNLVIGNNARAVDAAGQEAVRRGYSPAMICAQRSEGPAEDVGRHLAAMARTMRDEPGPDCLISGGEPVVRLVEAGRRGRGGRNQQLVLAALVDLQADGAHRVALLSGGTDGEDGPTDAAGAVLDAGVIQRAQERGLDPADFLARNDAYHFFGPVNGLIRTGPTHTNVCDVRVLTVAR